MQIPFTYYIEHLPTGKKYYGARWAKNCTPSDLWTTYFTSSKRIKQLIKEYGITSFKVEIRKIFNTVNDCKMWERKVLKRLKVVESDIWLNLNYGTPPTLSGVKWSKERKLKAIGKTLTEEHKNKISIAHIGKHKPQTEEHKRKCALTRIGKKRSIDIKIKMSESNYNRIPISIFKNNITHELFEGRIRDFSEKYKFNYNSLKSSICKNGKYKDWVKVK